MRWPWSPCRPSRRLNGSPLPYFNNPIMLPAVALYFLGPASSGASAVNTWPHKLHRSFCN
jgi:hypothetical protein